MKTKTNFNIYDYKNIHMIGIGGISMSGIAEILKAWNFNITGSDLTNSKLIEKLVDEGFKIAIGHDLNLVKNADLIIYSAAVKETDIEMIEANKLNIPTIERANILGEITKAFEETIAISGTHGKTTTTSMLSLCFLEAMLDPTIQVGATLKEIDSNYRIGKSNYFILEACEYVESFLKFRPKSEIILNIDNDHLDYFKNIDNIKKSFKKYVKLLPSDGLLVINNDDENCIEVAKSSHVKTLKYGIENQSEFMAKNIKYNELGFPSFDLYINNKFTDTILLSVPGKHNVSNSLACIALCSHYNISIEHIKNALSIFHGADRRFELIGILNKTVNIYDDYAHHPTEIEATIKAMKNKQYNESWGIFQPHTYSRTKNHLSEFTESLLELDNIILTDIYAARETNTYGISSLDLYNGLKKANKAVTYIKDFDEIADFILKNVKSNDIILTIGAGTITNLGKLILKKNEKEV